MNILLIALENNLVSQDMLKKIQSLQPGLEVIVENRNEEIERLLDRVEIAVGHFPFQFIARTPALRWFQQWGAGTDWLMRFPEAALCDFILTNASGVHAIPISEHILAMLLAFARRLPGAIRAQQRHLWNVEDHPHAFELAGKTMLLVGVGAIGERTAQIASALGMRAWGVRRDPTRAAPGIDQMFGPDDLEKALPDADFVVLTMPLTTETRGMFGASAFEKMKPSAYLVNIGRGGTVDEPALIHALQSGQIAGAGLDVFAREPLPEDSPLWDMPNVIITGHYSGDTPHYDARALEIFIDNLERYSNGTALRNVVDKQLGY